MKKMTSKLLTLSLGLGLLITGAVELSAKPRTRKPAGDTFYIYLERGSRDNNCTPSGWMGDYGDMKMNQGFTKGVAKPKKKSEMEKVDKKEMDVKSDGKDETSIQIRYSSERKQGAGWAGIYWQTPANNWGDKKGGFDLSGFRKLLFYARGETGEEVIDKFLIGGITGQTEEGDSDEASISPVELTQKWTEYEIDLNGLDMSHIIGCFGFALNADANPDGATFYLDDIRLVK